MLYSAVVAGVTARPPVIASGQRRRASTGKRFVENAAPADQTLTAGSVATYLARLASGAPAPGGGSVAALNAAQGAALLSMVLNLTVGRPKFAEHDAEARALLAETEALRAECAALIERDALALAALIATYKLPRGTAEEKAARALTLQERTRAATEVPLAVARAAAGLLPHCRTILPIGNPAAVSDIGVAATCAVAAFRGAELNVLINLGTLRDETFVAEARRELATLGAGLEDEAAAILREVRERL